ncbi:ABC transporter substrate-binding protein [Ornithinimicrobium faecis]|uniref:ABC transporter substrate-binding protein n=1 Tax=Ornithinimicrobium faecis TaxID=2934158 RepID=UPI0021197B9E|nr:ABC transporter substrate-binding protein [Ornithinimicrobium sp. HY1745]
MTILANDFSRRRFLIAIGAITAGAGLAACSDNSQAGTDPGGTTSTPTGAPQQGGSLTIGLGSVSDYLNPVVATTNSLAWSTAPVVETLYTWDASGASVPLLAAGEPEVSEDGLTWTVQIAEGITFSNGDALTAEHVAAAINHVSNPEAYTDWTNYFAYRITQAEATDEHTVVMTLPAPYGILRSHLNNLPIVHQDFLDTMDTTIGTGPFLLGEVIQGQSVQVVRNEDYHGTAPALDSITFSAIPDPATRLVNLREGTIQVMADVPPDNVAVLGQEDGITVHTVDAPISILTYFNATKAPFDNVQVRQALAHAMDRAGVRDLVYAGTADIAQGPSGPALEGHNADLQLFAEEPDVDKATTLLGEAGAEDLSFTLTVSNSTAEIVNLAQVLIEGWKLAGITCTLETIDGGAWVERWLAGDYEMTMTSFFTGVSGGRTAFTLFSPYASANPLNFGYSNPEVDTLLEQAWATDDVDERIELCQQIDTKLAEDAIAIPPVYPKFIIAQRDDVAALDESALQFGRLPAASAQLLG